MREAKGCGDDPTIQAALDAIPEGNPGRDVIHVEPGTYKGKVHVPAPRPFVTLRGDDARTTVRTDDWNAHCPGPDGEPAGTGAVGP